VLADHEVEAAARQRYALAVPLHEGEHRADPALLASGGRELLAGEVDRHGPGPGPGEPGREVGGAARQLGDVEAPDVSEDAEVALRDREEPPHRLLAVPQVVGRRVGEAFVHHRPDRAVQRDLVRPDVGHPIMLGAAALRLRRS
jgi:hypothetical protein